MVIAAELEHHPFAPNWLGSRGIPGLVSVIIPTYNRSALICDTLSSIAAQSWPSIEIILVDDGSSDDTHAVVSRWHAAHPSAALQMICQPNRGPANARNLGAGLASGEFIYFIDSDDLIVPDAIELLALPLTGTSEPFSVAHIRNADLACHPVPGDTEGLSRIVTGYFFSSRWMTHAALYRRETLAAAGPFDEQLARGEDTEHLWRILATSGPGPIIPNFIGVRRLHSYGHLCVGRSLADAARDDLTTIGHFTEWAAANCLIDRAMARSIVRRATIVAIRAGRARDWRSNADAIALLARMEPWRHPLKLLAYSPLKLRWHAVYAPLGLTIELLKWLRDWLMRLKADVRDQLGPAKATKMVDWSVKARECTADLGG